MNSLDIYQRDFMIFYSIYKKNWIINRITLKKTTTKSNLLLGKFKY